MQFPAKCKENAKVTLLRVVDLGIYAFQECPCSNALTVSHDWALHQFDMLHAVSERKQQNPYFRLMEDMTVLKNWKAPATFPFQHVRSVCRIEMFY